MGIENSQVIFVSEVKDKFDKSKTLEENMELAMKEAKSHWLISQYMDDKKTFDAAIISVSSFYGVESEEFQRITDEMKMVNALFFTPTNVPIDYQRLLDELPKDHKKIGIIDMWRKLEK